MSYIADWAAHRDAVKARRQTRYPGELPDRWKLVAWWVFWRPKWYRRIYDGADRGAGWNVQYATDVERARLALEERFGT